MIKKQSVKSKRTKVFKKPVSLSPKKKENKEPQTMEELLNKTGYKLQGWKRGEVIKAVVVEKTRGVLYLDIGGKSEGMVIDRELKAARDFVNNLKAGDKISAVVTQPENDRGQTLLSLKNSAQDYLWNSFEEKLKAKTALRVFGKDVNKGGLIVEAGGLQGFIPSSQFGKELAEDIDQLVEEWVEVKPIEVDREKNRLIFSEKEVSEAELLKAQEEILDKVKKGDNYKATVVGVMPFGLFMKVKVGKVYLEGLVHISEISWKKVDSPVDYYKEGDAVDVMILATDNKSGRLNLSIKQLQKDPWENIDKRYPADKKIKGEIIRVAPFGAFVDIEEGIEGLIHVSKIPAEKVFKIKEKVDCFIESVDKEGRRISLGLVLSEKPVGYK
ncbi:MAG: S1 RNA-binding domain-containing protein [Patescibacteria group bacterium]